MDQYKDIFLSESAEFIQGITEGLLALESNAADLEPVEVIFRGAHSLKGMAAAMGYDRTSDLTHKMESLMDRVRQRELSPDSALIDLMLEAVDMVRALIDDESEGGSGVDSGQLASRLVAMAEGSKPDSQDGSAAGEATESGHVDTGESAEGAEAAHSENEDAQALASETSSESGSTPIARVAVTLDENCVLKAVRAYMVMKRLNHMGHVVDTEPGTREIEDEEFDREFAVLLETESSLEDIEQACLGVSEIAQAKAELVHIPSAEPVVEKAAVSEEESAAPGPRKRTQIPKLSETQTVRVAIGHLDTLVNLVGELVILRSRLERIASEAENRELDDALEDMHRVAAELQHEVMHTRMVPVGNIFNRFPRMVRDLARELGKDIEFQMDGLDIELDRTVLDEIGDPIVHLLRNSVDHGIEAVADRESSGKSARGKVTLSAARERDQVTITVSDDGRGIDCDRVWAKALERGLVSASEREAYSQEQVLQLTCVPGFSTAETATKVSGRGVGMDVVKGKIEHLGGSLRIRSESSLGCSFELTLPLTLAIIQALMIDLEGQTFAIPLSSVDEVLSAEDTTTDTVDGAPVVLHRDGEVISVYALEYLLGLAVENRPPQGDEPVVIVESAGSRRALLVGRIEGRQEIVIKPLSRMFNQVAGIGGATVLGDGRVAMIIDPRSIFPGREEGV